MDADRLKALFEAYGGDPSRWPERDRAAGLALSAMAEPETFEAELALDAWLDAWAIEPATLDLRQRILHHAAGSPVARTAWRPLRLWLQGACLAAACAAGILTGVSLGRVDRTVRSATDRDAESVAAMYDMGTISGAQPDETT